LENGSQDIFFPAFIDNIYGFPVLGCRHRCGRVRKDSKCDWRSVHVIEGEYLKRTMCVIGVEFGREEMDEVEVGVREPMLLDDRSFEG
jgi:hypothetical protein